MPQLCSVICLAYNHERFAAAALQSIYEQEWPNIEIIVLDDGSIDSTVEVVREKLKESPFPVKLTTQSNTGNVPQNFNRGLSQATGSFVMFLSLDDMLLPGCIESRMQLLETDVRVVFAADVGYQEINENGAVIGAEGKMPVATHQISDAAALLEAEYETIGTFYIQGQIFRRDAVYAVGGFDEGMTGDDIVLRTKLFYHLMANPELRFSLGKRMVLGYRRHDGNLHRRFHRQFRTVIEWKKKFFPDRTYPKKFFSWLENCFQEYVRGNVSEEELANIVALDPLIAEVYKEFRSRRKTRRRLFRKRLTSLFGLVGTRTQKG